MGGTDSQVVKFRATPGERVSIRTPEQQRGSSGDGHVTNISFDFSGAVVDTAKIRQEILRAVPDITDAAGAKSKRLAGASVGGTAGWGRAR